MPTKKIEEAEEVTRCPECNSGHLSFVVEREVSRVALRTSSDFFGLFDLLGWHGFPHRRRRRLRSGTGRRGRPGGPRQKAPGPVRTLSRPVPEADSACRAHRRLARG